MGREEDTAEDSSQDPSVPQDPGSQAPHPRSAGRPVGATENPTRTVPPVAPKVVGFLLSQLGYETARRFGLLMAEVELEPRQFAVLRTIGAYEGQTQNAVGELFRIPPSSMVALVDHLESRGLVERRPHPSDRRSRTLHVTTSGKEVLKRAMELAMSLETTICQGISGEERARLLDLLSRIMGNFGLAPGTHPGATGSGESSPWRDLH